MMQYTYLLQGSMGVLHPVMQPAVRPDWGFMSHLDQPEVVAHHLGATLQECPMYAYE